MTREELMKAGAKSSKTFSREELLRMGATTTQKSTAAPKPGAGADLKNAGGKIIEDVKKRGGQFKEVLGQASRGEINPLSAGLRFAGTAAATVTDIAVESIKGAAKAAIPQSVEDELRVRLDQALATPTGRAGVEAVLSIMDKYGSFKQQNPELAKDIEAGANILSVVPVERALKGGAEIATDIAAGTLKKAGQTASAIGSGASRVADTARNVTQTAKDVGQTLKSISGKALDFTKSVPRRFEAAADVSRKQAAEMAVATPASRKAAKMGIKLRHANLVEKATPEEKELFRDMFNQAKTFETDRSSVSPADIGGSQLQKRIAEADVLRESVGKQLGEVAKGLEGQETPARLAVLQRLKEVPGLKGLKITNKGALDFSDTTLSSNLTSSDRNIIEQAFQAIKGKDASGQHMLRQEIFEVTGGRKKAQIPLTDTQDRALEAIRQGLADALERISLQYKTINQRYARLTEPLKKLRKSFSGLEGASTDILDEASAKLMRRLTSESMGGSKLKDAISKLDEVLTLEGQKPKVSLQKLQDFSNALDEYFDIVKDTSFAGQTSLGVRGGARGVFDLLLEKAADALQSNDIQKKALEDLLFNSP